MDKTQKEQKTASKRGRKKLPAADKKVRLTVFIRKKDLESFRIVMQKFA